ncbi:hypothetical protein CBOM_06814 [Ceraceosorus bombacis]|uniref:Uncharacterized protein n=1 Tax=Ceraceosorus bombacis TaxID=401625 RepID=A0A0N7LBI7_9BASI|nr:hypothetical protein CBOM_06814 [Ceraceosorus bombacis]
MLFHKEFSPCLVVLAIVATLAQGATVKERASNQCQAVGTAHSFSTTTGDLPMIHPLTVQILRDGQEIASVDNVQCNNGVDPPTTTQIQSSLPLPFGWSATCGTASIEECHGAYGRDRDIKGEAPTSEPFLQGPLPNILWTCKINFDCILL